MAICARLIPGRAVISLSSGPFMYSITSTKPPSTVFSVVGHMAWKAMAMPITAKNSIEPKVSALTKMLAARMFERQMFSVAP
ncbi:hypothetical protein APX70_02946 [Pseudomonas syringae pv. maculicola]|uniref:Uncharacterized protein n=1 Tax=Pseudomonas syringae pv. maculicola TaxID=59511 RepID=A0A3M2U535_PSEYM|nr:hypothetical protein APX70_02946 [Pseudomonas syringae pv. maculicola]